MLTAVCDQYTKDSYGPTVWQYEEVQIIISEKKVRQVGCPFSSFPAFYTFFSSFFVSFFSSFFSFFSSFFSFFSSFFSDFPLFFFVLFFLRVLDFFLLWKNPLAGKFPSRHHIEFHLRAAT